MLARFGYYLVRKAGIALALHPHFQAALSPQREASIRAAASIYARLVRENPKDAGALHHLGLACMQLGDLAGAERCLERSVSLQPASANALTDFGSVKAKRKDFDQAIALFSRALAIDAGHLDALNNLAYTLNALRRPHEALTYLERLCRLQPDSAEAVARLAHTCLKLGDAERAIDGFRKAIRLDPQRCRARILLGEALEAVGSFKQAQAQYLNVLRRDQRNVTALARLLSLHEGNLDSRWLETARELIRGDQLEELERIQLHVALGQYFDRSGAYDDAFANFHAGFRMQFEKAPFDSKGFSAAVDTLIESCSAERLAKPPRHEIGSARPIFIVGMPRSGTTLMEQILASHPDVAAGGELSTIMSIGSQIHLLGANPRAYPEGLWGLAPADLGRMAQRYLDRLDGISRTSARVTDKQPFNFMHLGLITLLFPEASIIHCRRQPLDNCLSCYFVSFADEFQFASDLHAIAHYYRDYHRLMTHWRSVLPSILDVQYEELVSDTRSMVRKVLDHCGLRWEESCLSFHQTRRTVRTPSRWQVRQPIYSRSIGRWKNYEKHLTPLKELLRPLLDETHAD